MTAANTIALFVLLVVAAGCRDEQAVPAPIARPSFAPTFPPVSGDLISRSSPNLADLNRDGVPDIVFGTGIERLRPAGERYVFVNEPEVSGYVVAVSGATNDVLWRVPNPRDAFTTPRFLDVNGDSISDVIMGGREGAFSAFNGIDGALLWRVPPARVARTPVPYNFFTPGLLRDINADGVGDIAVVYAGDDTRLPNDPRDVGYLAVISGADGAVVRVHPMPDGNESYSPVVVYDRADGSEWIIFGTGGETHGGAAFRAPTSSLLDGTFASRVERLITPGERSGTIAPAVLVERTGDTELDIVLTTFDGRLIALDGVSRSILWEQHARGEETYHSAAVVRIGRDDELALFVSRGIGAFPRYVGTTHRLHAATDGRLLYEFKETNYPGGAPLAVDLNGDGIDEPVFFSQRYPSAQGGRIHILDRRSELVVHDLPGNLMSTPVIGDPRRTGALELIGLSWRIDQSVERPTWRNMTWELLRLNLDARPPASLTWAAYMGTATDGQYRGTAPTRAARP